MILRFQLDDEALTRKSRFTVSCSNGEEFQTRRVPQNGTKTKKRSSPHYICPTVSSCVLGSVSRLNLSNQRHFKCEYFKLNRYIYTS